MSRKSLTGIAVIAFMIMLGVLAWRKNDAMSGVQRDNTESLERSKESKVQRDITESLERSKASKAQRDSIEYVLRAQRFEKIRQYELADSMHDARALTVENVSFTFRDSEPNAVVNRARPSPDEASIPKGRMFATAAMDGLVPHEPATIFHTGNPVYIYAGIHAPVMEEVRFEWLDRHGKCIEAPAYINVLPNTGETGYRIYQYRKFDKTGRYEARIYNCAGKLIGSTKFTVESAYRARIQPRDMVIAGFGG